MHPAPNAAKLLSKNRGRTLTIEDRGALEQASRSSEANRLSRAGSLLGAGKIFMRAPKSLLDLHSSIVEGTYPYAALFTLASALAHPDDRDVA